MNDGGFLQELLAKPDDRTTRLVYADWLDERDDPRGEFLRVELTMLDLHAASPRREELRQHLDQLRENIAPDWLAALDRTGIDNCRLRFEFECPLKWQALEPTQEDAVRFCSQCKKNVYHCQSVEEAQAHAYQGHCVAIDSRTPRTPGDLRESPDFEHVTMGILVNLTSLESQEERTTEDPPASPRRWWQFWKRG